MGKWIACGGRVIPGDVVRWTEAIWREKRKGRKQVMEKIGDRRVTAFVWAVDDAFVSVSVMKCEIVSNKHGMPLELLKRDQTMRKKRATIEQGSGERLKWSEEAARSLAESKFLN